MKKTISILVLLVSILFMGCGTTDNGVSGSTEHLVKMRCDYTFKADFRIVNDSTIWVAGKEYVVPIEAHCEHNEYCMVVSVDNYREYLMGRLPSQYEESTIVKDTLLTESEVSRHEFAVILYADDMAWLFNAESNASQYPTPPRTIPMELVSVECREDPYIVD